MKNFLKCLVFASFLVVSPLAAFSMDDMTTENLENVLIERSGQIISIDLEEQQVIIEYQLENEESVISEIFYFSEAVEIYKNEQVVPVSELKEGDNVAITYVVDENGEKMIRTLVLQAS